MLHDLLWQLNSDLADACLEHPFVQRLGEGSLSKQAFSQYIAQDAFFLKTFLRAYAMGAAKCDDLVYAQEFHELMGGVLDELKLHAGYASKLKIDLTHVEPYPATSAYTDFLLRTAWHCGIDEIVAGMVPCMRLLRILGYSAGNLVAQRAPLR